MPSEMAATAVGLEHLLPVLREMRCPKYAGWEGWGRTSDRHINSVLPCLLATSQCECRDRGTARGQEACAEPEEPFEELPSIHHDLTE